jgi:hypothetical protein
MNASRATVEDVARAAGAALNIDVAIILQEQWVSERYANIASRTTLRALHRTAELTVPALVSAGTVSIGNGGTIITGDATAVAAWGAAVIGRFIQLHTAWYEIAGAINDTLELVGTYTEDDVTDGSYRIVQRYFTLADDTRTLGDFVLSQRRLRIGKLSLADLDYLAPYRQHYGYGPVAVVDFGSDAQGRKVVELYPYPQTMQQVRYDYWAHPPRLELTDSIPGSVDLHALKEGVLIDCMRFLAARAMQAGDAAGAGFWRNESRAQETRWEGFVNQALLNDRGLDDLETRMRSSMGPVSGTDILTSFDEIWSRGQRP